MKRLEPPDSHYLSAASGWVGLGDWREAELELANISHDMQSHPDTLEVRYEIYSKTRRWEECVEAARAITEIAPERPFGWVHAAYALHELKRTTEAYDALLPILKQFPEEWVIRYNLACYACQLGRQSEAFDWLKQAFALGDREELKRMALSDPDLAPMKKAIKELAK